MATSFGNSKYPQKSIPADAGALLRFDRLKKIALDCDFEILDPQWKGAKAIYQFKNIKTGRIRESTADSIFRRGVLRETRTADENFNEIKSLAEQHGFELLDSKWHGPAAKHRFKHIASGVIYEGRPSNLRKDGFPADLRTANDRFIALSTFAYKHGFELLDSEWLGSKTRHRFKHIASGELYQGAPGQLFSQGFPKDLRVHLNRPVDENANAAKLKDLAEYAVLHGFQLLDTTWIGSIEKYKFQNIETGQVYEGCPSQLRKRGFPKDIRTLQDRYLELSTYAKENGFELLESEWLGAEKKHQFRQLSTGKIYSSIPAVQRTGFPKDLRTSQDRWNDLSSSAIENGFKLLEPEWLGFDSVHKFEHLSTGDLYEWSPSQVHRGFPAVRGQRFVTEEVCRQIMQHIFGGEFRSNSHRLAGLHRKHIQLDGLETFVETPTVIKEAGSIVRVNKQPWDFDEPITEIAFEFQGHQGHLEDAAVIARDQLRIDYCRQLGILLIVIDPPDDWKYIRDSEYMFNHVCNSIRASIITTKEMHFSPGFTLNLRDWHPDLEAHAKLNQFATANDFELLDKRWNGAKSYYRFKSLRTNNVYEWEASKVMNSGFPKDLRTDAEKFDNLVEFSQKNGFEVVDTTWRGIKNRHTFKHLDSGKLYAWITDNILNRGFPKNLRTDTERFERLSHKAESHGFELLEDRWLGGKIKHQFRHVASGTLYQALPDNVLRVGFPKSFDNVLAKSRAASKADTQDISQQIGDLFFDEGPPPNSFFIPAAGVAEHIETAVEATTVSVSR